MRLVLLALTIALAWLLVTPDALWAWGAPTHAYISTHILNNLALLPVVVQEVLAAHPGPFLYGSLAADIPLAKRYVAYQKHGHNWSVAFEILARTETPELRAFALGYLSHLAADAIAHNVFVPRQLLATPLSSGLGHTYWEYRFDATLDDRYLRMARETVLMDHAQQDALLEEMLTHTVFTFQTNKRIYRQILFLSNQEPWDRFGVRRAEGSRWLLDSETTALFSTASIEFVRDLLSRGASSLPRSFDPVGLQPLSIAKRLRRDSFRRARKQVRREFRQAPIRVARAGGTSRLISRSIPKAELIVMATVQFPMPPFPHERGLGADEPASTDPREFWRAFHQTDEQRTK